MKVEVDRKSGISLRQQLKGAIEHGIFFGDLAIGANLPSVRDLAVQAGVAPMTVAKVYADLKAAGLIETRTGSGTSVADSVQARMAVQPGVAALRAAVDRATDLALGIGADPADIPGLISARVTARLASGRRKSIVVVGLFADATASYAQRVAAQVGDHATVEATTLDQISDEPDRATRLRAADLVLTFANLQAAVTGLAMGVPVLSIRFIPSEATRMALAAIDPMARVGVVSRFSDFLPVLTLGVRRFAAHVRDIAAANLDDATIAALLENCDVAVRATGADDAARLAKPGAARIEYRHIPDPGDIDRLVMPLVNPIPDPQGLSANGPRVTLARKEA
ncbi:MAG: GntR family transcriptional regulator [Pseudorhodobacter sp.]|nr:GntR family transcriptional regulator [Pseudorhodobacter sp.]